MQGFFPCCSQSIHCKFDYVHVLEMLCKVQATKQQAPVIREQIIRQSASNRAFYVAVVAK